MRLTMMAAFVAVSFSQAFAGGVSLQATGFPGSPHHDSHAARILQAHEAASEAFATGQFFATGKAEEQGAPLQLPFAGDDGAKGSNSSGLGSGLFAFVPNSGARTAGAKATQRGDFAWSGAYAGLSLGATAFSSDTTNTMYDPFSISANGMITGILAGYNWQKGSIVAGIEADFDLSGHEGSAGTGGGFTTSDERYHLREEWRASLRGRVGRTVGRGMVYATAGLAFVKAAQFYTEPGWAPTEDVHQILPGWTAGIGWEAPIAKRWTLRAEYRLSGFAAHTFQCAMCGPADNDFTTNDIRAAISFRF